MTTAKMIYLIRRSILMGTAKNDFIMLLYMVKKSLMKKVKMRKSATAFAQIGRAWQESTNKKIIVFWGIHSSQRSEIAEYLPEFKCAFAFGHTAPERQVDFLKKNIPYLIIFPASQAAIHPLISRFIEKYNIQTINMGAKQAIEKIHQYTPCSIKYFGDNQIYFSTTLYINIDYDIIDILHKKHNKERNISINITDSDDIFNTLDKYDNIEHIYIYTNSSPQILQTINCYCNTNNIHLNTLSENNLFEVLFGKQSSSINEKYAILWGMSKLDNSRVASCLSDYTVLELEENISFNTFNNVFPIISHKYNFIFCSFENSIPETIENLAKKLNIPIYHLHSSLIDKLYYRKPFKNPFFTTLSTTRTNKLGLPERRAFISWLNNHSNKLDTEHIFYHLHALHALLCKGRKTPPQALIDLQKKDFVLAVWHIEETEELSLENFLNEVGKNIKQAYIVCLALTEENKCYQSKDLPDEIRFRTIFLNHAEDFDFLCAQAKEVHVIGSFYGFEALLAGCPVVTYGEPFYAGFGWTKDLLCPREPNNYSFLQAASIALFGSQTHAPYSGEVLTPDQVIVLHHLRLRSDFSYIFEQINNRLGKDERYPTLDLRRKYYHLTDPNMTQYILKNLTGSDLGLLLHSLFNFNYQCQSLERLFSYMPTQALFNLLITIATYCRINSLFDMLCDITNKYVKWFSEQSLNKQETFQFYNIYFFLQQSNRYRNLDFPPLKNFENQDNIELYEIYTKIATYSCNYEAIYYIIENIHPLPIRYCNSALTFLMEYPYGSREKNFHARLNLRQKIFSMLLDMIIADEKVSISDNAIALIRSSLMEDLPQVKKYALTVIAEQEQGSAITSPVASIILSLLNSYIVRCYYAEAELFLRILSGSKIKKESYIAQWKRLRKIADGFIPLGMTSAKRKQHLEKIALTAQQQCLKSTSLQEVYTHSWRAAIETFNLTTSNIIARVSQPQAPLGYILIPQFGLFQTAILPLLVCSLAKRGYASIILSNNHLYIHSRQYNELYNFSYSTTERPLRLSCSWNINLEKKEISAFGINFYDRFKEFLRVQLRIFNIDMNNPIQRSYLQQFIYQADAHLKVCTDIYKICNKNNLKCAFLSTFLLLLPQVIWFDFIEAQNDKNFRTIFCRTALTQKMKEGVDMEEVSICAMDMACHPEQRLPFLPNREKFQSWYHEFRKTPCSGQILAEIRKNLLCPAPNDSPIYDRLLAEKASGKKIVFCYSRLLYDLSLRTADGGPGHDNMEDWLTHSIQIAERNKNIILVIKPHPHEEEPEFAAMPVEKLQDILPDLPENVFLLHPKEIKTPQLVGIVDMVVLWLGTAIGELTALGIPVIVCSYAGINDTPFDVKTFKDREEYSRLLEEVSCPPPLPDEQDIATGLIKFSRDGYMVTPYKYSFFSASNDFRSIPYYDDEAIERYFKEGDPDIEHIVDQILEGFDDKSSLLAEN